MPEKMKFIEDKMRCVLMANKLQQNIYRIFSNYSEGLITKSEMEICIKSNLDKNSEEILEIVKAITF